MDVLGTFGESDMLRAIPAFLLALVFATGASAEPPEGKGKNKEVVTTPVIRDASGIAIGTFLDLGGVIAAILYRGDPLNSEFFETHPIIVLRLSPDGFFLDKNVFFTQSGCSGQSYTGLTVENTPDMFDLTIFPAYEDAVLGPVAFLPTDPNWPDTPTSTVEIFSILSGLGQCDDDPSPGFISGQVSVEKVELGLPSPPYQLSD